MNKKFEPHFNPETMSVSDLKGVFKEYETLIKFIYNSEDVDFAKRSIEDSMKYINIIYKTYNGRIV